MNGADQQIRQKEHLEDLEKLHWLRPIDDDFMRCLFRDNIPLAQMVLRILTEKKDLVIENLTTQKDLMISRRKINLLRCICK